MSEQPATKMRDQWLDDVIRPVAHTRNPHVIGHAIASCWRIQDAIRRGISNAQPGVPGGDLTQTIRGEFQREVESTDEH